MSVLSDVSIRTMLAARRLGVEPFNPEAVGPCSLDVTLGDELLALVGSELLDTVSGAGARYERQQTNGRGGWTLYPHGLYLAATAERVSVPSDLVAYLHGRSTLGRYGVSVHETAGLIDPGFRGHVTLEITVARATVLYPGQPIGQLTFERLTTPVERPYGERGRYQDSVGAVPPIPFGAARAELCSCCREVPE